MSLYYSVRVCSLVAISDKCYKATAYDGSVALIPKSQVMGVDYEVSKSDAYWISAWILNLRPDFQFSKRKCANFTADGKMYPNIIFEVHRPDLLEPIIITADESLVR